MPDATTAAARADEGGGPSSSGGSSLLPRLASASVGSLATALAVTPLEVVKVRQQAAAAAAAAASAASRPPGGIAGSGAPSVHAASRCGGCGVLVPGLGGQGSPAAAATPSAAAGAGARRRATLTAAAASSSTSTSTSSTVSGRAARPAAPPGAVAVLRHILRTEGLAGAYAGLGATLAMAVPNTVLYFAAYDEIAERLRAGAAGGREPAESAYDRYAVPLLSGSSARLLATAATAPLELVRTRQAGRRGRTTAMQEVREIWRAAGGRGGVGGGGGGTAAAAAAGLFRGLGPTLARDVPFSAIYWVALENSRQALERIDGDAGGGSAVSPGRAAARSFLGGALGGAVASFCTAPFDVVKTRRQTEPPAPRLCHCPPSGTLRRLQAIVAGEGWASLWRGNATRTAKVAPACAIMIGCYELGKELLGDGGRA